MDIFYIFFENSMNTLRARKTVQGFLTLYLRIFRSLQTIGGHYQIAMPISDCIAFIVFDATLYNIIIFDSINNVRLAQLLSRHAEASIGDILQNYSSPP